MASPDDKQLFELSQKSTIDPADLLLIGNSQNTPVTPATVPISLLDSRYQILAAGLALALG